MAARFRRFSLIFNTVARRSSNLAVITIEKGGGGKICHTPEATDYLHPQLLPTKNNLNHVR
jgi:hypothetical protein